MSAERNFSLIPSQLPCEVDAKVAFMDIFADRVSVFCKHALCFTEFFSRNNAKIKILKILVMFKPLCILNYIKTCIAKRVHYFSESA